MLHPSYTELMERINKDVEEGDTPIVQSRYSIVKATADRAKQIIDARSIGDKIEKQIKNDATAEPVITDSQHLTMKKGSPLIDGNTDDMKPLSIAIEELYTGKVKIAEHKAADDLVAEADVSAKEPAELDEETADTEPDGTEEDKDDQAAEEAAEDTDDNEPDEADEDDDKDEDDD